MIGSKQNGGQQMRLAASLVLSALLGACPKPIEPNNTPLDPVKTETKPEAAVQTPFIALTHNGERFMGKPPSKTFYVDATLTNEQKTSRWILFQGTTPDSVSRPEGGVDVLQLFQPKGEGKVIAIEMLGTNLYEWAFLLPGGASITVKNIPIGNWDEDIPTELQIKAIFASSLSFGGKDASTYLKEDPSCDAKATVAFERSKSNNMTGSIKFSDDYKEIPLEYKAEHSVTLKVPTKR
jgi:hypothetical protein